ncbi:unnamed protein product [Allacma fusca]|uniref:SET domain-containing protein n=1 Tax=Allacma fusca TaxID=39272 RepID=A0A8J2KHL4_9HEXA|nr:unnamed protein product [Allacma fusca]
MGRKKHSKKLSTAVVDENASAGDTNEEPKLYTCEVSPIFGRYLKSKVEIKKGTLILSEKYLVAGPMRSSGLICLGCHSEFRDNKDRRQCSKCSWPVCGEKCASSKFHVNECKFFMENKIPPPRVLDNNSETAFDFGAITVLRGLLLKLNNEHDWKLLQTLEHHSQVRKDLPLWEENVKNVVEPLGKRYELNKFFTDEEIHNVCGILEVNAFELGEEFSYRGIFPSAAMMAHECIPNATHFEDSKEGIIQIRSTVDIPPGTPITGTTQRRRMLVETKFFECVCDRCSDPAELGTNMSTLLCPKCRTGHVLNAKAKDKDILWQCSSCQAIMYPEEVDLLLDKYMSTAESTNGVRASETFLQDCSKYFHKNHFVPFGVKFNLCQAYGREKTPIQELHESELEKKLVLCQEVLEILDRVTPGYTITRGLILYELQATEILMSRRLFETRKFSKALLKRRLEGTVKILMEAIDILSFAHESTPEYAMAAAAKAETLIDLRRWINILKSK